MANSIEPGSDQQQKHPGFLVVGLGASAGGVEALQSFFTHVPADSGAAYVVVLHLSPEHDSHLASILQSATPLAVTQVTEAVRVEPNHVYVVAPNQHLAMLDGTLTVSPNTQSEDRRAPIDIFFRTLAESHESRAACVILSGTGADGAMGLKRVKERGGVVFSQSPLEAAFNEMPRSAIATELVDEVLPVAAIPARIIAYQASLGTVAIPVEAVQRSEDQQQALREVFTQLRVRTGHDFSNYKRPTLLRRIERRIGVRGLSDLPTYAAFLRDNPDEVRALLKDLLISVTNFFRDKEAFADLEREILPRIFAGKRPDEQVRIWVAGCATGEEAYSIAMLCAERALGAVDTPSVQIFATDIDEAAIAHAREGLYTVNETVDVSPERLRRFFTAEDQRFRIRREVRELVLFATHNILKDPPFSRLDLVSCRNLLIYLNHTAQERVMETLNFALLPGGYLLLGTSESVDSANDLYVPVNREHRLFQSRLASTRPLPVPDAMPPRSGGSLSLAPAAAERSERARERLSYGELHQRLLEEYAPPSVVIDQDYEIVHLSERAGRYLQVAGGEPSNNLLKLIRPELRLELRTALYQASQRQANVDTSALPLRIDDRAELVTIHVRPVLRPDDPARGLLLVLFEPSTQATSDAELVFRSEEPIAQQLEEQVARLKQQLRSSTEQYEFQTEELRATNEELQALNEELRSSTEELETSKEELQSINEELRTVNQELKVKVEEATLHSTNLQNLVNSTDIGTIFLDRSLRVKLFTPAARELFNLIPSDYGRALSDITHRLVEADVLADAENVLEKLRTIEREVRTSTGRVFLLRVLPYRAAEDRIGGVVVTFIEITERKRAEDTMRRSAEANALRVALADALRPLDSPAAILDTATRVLGAHLGDAHVLFGELGDDGSIVGREYADGPAKPAGQLKLRDFAPASIRALRAGQSVVTPDLANAAEPPEKARAANGGADTAAQVAVPLLRDGQLAAVLVVRKRAPHIWLAGDVALIEDAAEHTWALFERARGEAALRQSEARLQQATDAGSIGIGVWDIAANRIVGNQQMANILGLDTESVEAGLPREAVMALVHDDDRERVERAFAQALAAGGEYDLEYRVARRDRICWVHARGRVERDGGSPVRVPGTLIDITERKLMEEQLRASGARFHILSDALPQLIWTNDASGQANYFNQRWYDYCGLSYAESAGLGWQAIVHAGDAPASVERWQHALAAGAVFETEYRLRRADGVYRWHLGRNVPLHNADGQVAGWFGSATDVEDMKRAEAARRESDERFRLLVEGARDFAMFLIALDNRITFWSTGAERVFGWSEAEALGQSSSIIFTPEDRERGAVEQEVSAALRDGKALDRRWHLRKDGTRLFIDGALIRLDGDDGRPSGFVKVGRDATAQREAEEAVQRTRDELEQRVAERTEALSTANARLLAEIDARAQLERSRQDLLRQLVTAQEDERRRIARELHDQLGQEITGILLQLKLLQQSAPPDEALAGQLHNITELTQRLASEAHQLAVELRPTALDDVGLAAALRHYVTLWAERTRLAADLQLDGLDERRLPSEVETVVYRVVQEALTNVIKHAQAQRVGIILLVHGGAVQLIVEDDGQGFDSEAPPTTGSLGLASMRERVEQVGGSFSVESAPGAGTTIYARMPLPAAA